MFSWYRCVIKVFLTTDPPQKVWLDSPPEDTPLRSGTRVTLVCHSTGGNPAATLTWFKVRHFVCELQCLSDVHTLINDSCFRMTRRWLTHNRRHPLIWPWLVSSAWSWRPVTTWLPTAAMPRTKQRRPSLHAQSSWFTVSETAALEHKYHLTFIPHTELRHAY